MAKTKNNLQLNNKILRKIKIINNSLKFDLLELISNLIEMPDIQKFENSFDIVLIIA